MSGRAGGVSGSYAFSDPRHRLSGKKRKQRDKRAAKGGTEPCGTVFLTLRFTPDAQKANGAAQDAPAAGTAVSKAAHAHAPEPEPEPASPPSPSPTAAATAPSTSVWVRGIPSSHAEPDTLRQLFAQHGEIVSAEVRRKSGEETAWALLTFRDIDAAVRRTLRTTLCTRPMLICLALAVSTGRRGRETAHDPSSIQGRRQGGGGAER